MAIITTSLFRYYFIEVLCTKSQLLYTCGTMTSSFKNLPSTEMFTDLFNLLKVDTAESEDNEPMERKSSFRKSFKGVMNRATEEAEKKQRYRIIKSLERFFR